MVPRGLVHLLEELPERIGESVQCRIRRSLSLAGLRIGRSAATGPQPPLVPFGRTAIAADARFHGAPASRSACDGLGGVCLAARYPATNASQAATSSLFVPTRPV